MEPKTTRITIIIIAVVVIAAAGLFAYLKEMGYVGYQIPKTLIPMLSRQVLLEQGATVLENKVQSISDDMEQTVFVYNAEIELSALYNYFKNYFNKNPLRLTVDSLNSTTFTLNAADTNQNYNIVATKNSSENSENNLVNISFLRKI